jgi:hypothetical protein
MDSRVPPQKSRRHILTANALLHNAARASGRRLDLFAPLDGAGFEAFLKLFHRVRVAAVEKLVRLVPFGALLPSAAISCSPLYRNQSDLYSEGSAGFNAGNSAKIGALY